MSQIKDHILKIINNCNYQFVDIDGNISEETLLDLYNHSEKYKYCVDRLMEDPSINSVLPIIAILVRGNDGLLQKLEEERMLKLSGFEEAQILN